MKKPLTKTEEQALAHVLNLMTKVKELELMTLKVSLALMQDERTPAQLAQDVLDIDAAAHALPTNKTIRALSHLAFPEGLTRHVQTQWIDNAIRERQLRQRKERRNG